jgi:hypothetical protein
MKSRRLSRRALLRGVGGVVVALPFLDAMTAKAQSNSAAKRLVIFYSPNGTNAGDSPELAEEIDFWPAAMGAGFVLGGEVSPLESLREKLLFVSGINAESCYADRALGVGDSHSIGLSQMLTGVQFIEDGSTYGKVSNQTAGYAGGISIDQHIAKSLGTSTRFPSLEFGVITSTDAGVMPFSRMISAGPNQPVPPIEDPAAMFQRIFSDGTPESTGAVDTSFAERRSVLDFVAEDLESLAAEVGVTDRQKLDLHLTAVRELEQRLQGDGTVGGATASCDASSAPQNPGDPQLKENFPAIGKLQMDVLALALKCDVTRVASLQWSWSRSNLVHTWVGATAGHHDLSHDHSSASLSAINHWYAEQFAYLGQALDAVEDVDGTTLLDNTLVYWCSDVAYGWTHTWENVRAVFLGGCGGAVKTGQHINVGGEPHQKLLVTLMNAMGVEGSEFGDTSYGTGALSSLLV